MLWASLVDILFRFLNLRLDVVFHIQEQTHDIEEQVHGKRTYIAIKVFLVLAPLSVIAAYVNIYLENFGVIFWIAGMLSVSTMILVGIAGGIFNRALEGIYKGSYLRHVSTFPSKSKVKINVYLVLFTFGLRALFNFVRAIFNQQYIEIRKNGDNRRYFFPIAFFLLTLATDVIPLLVFI